LSLCIPPFVTASRAGGVFLCLGTTTAFVGRGGRGGRCKGMYETQQEFPKGEPKILPGKGFGIIFSETPKGEIPGDKHLNTFESIKPSFSSGQS